MAQMGQSGAHIGPTGDRISPFGAYMSKLWLKLINFGLIRFTWGSVGKTGSNGLIWSSNGPESINLGLEWMKLCPNEST